MLVKGYSLFVASGALQAFREPSLLIFKLPIFLIGILLFEAARNERPVTRYGALLVAAAIAIYEQRLYGEERWMLLGLVALIALLLLRPRLSGTWICVVIRRLTDRRVGYSQWL